MENIFPFLLAGGIVFLTVLIIFLLVGLQPLMRAIIKSTGHPCPGQNSGSKHWEMGDDGWQ